MSCGCNSGWGDNGVYSGVCDTDTPYPSVSAESVPSLISNLIDALYGQITKDVTSGQVVWNIPCDPNKSATIFNIPRDAGEGLLCYFLRVWDTAGPSGVVTTTDVQTLTNKTLTSPVINAPTINSGTLTGAFTGGSFSSTTFANPSMTGNAVITTSSNFPALKITQTGTGNCLLIEDEPSETTPFVITNAGNVGIGTASPTDKLNVAGNIGVSGDSSVAGNSSVTGNINTIASMGIGTASVPTGRMDVVGSAGTFRVATTGDDVSFTKAGANSIGTSTAGGTLIFKTGAAASAVTIDSAQNVGIGTTTTLTTKLEVNGQIKATSLNAPLIGITNASNALSGEVGQIITATGTATFATPTGAWINPTSIVLTAGDWLIWGSIIIIGNTTTATTLFTTARGAVHTAVSNWDATLPDRNVQIWVPSMTMSTTIGVVHLPIAQSRVNISVGATYYLNAFCVYGVNAPSAKGTITAKRIR